MKPGDEMELKHLFALIWHELKTDPWTFVKEAPDGSLDWSQFIEVWSGLEWRLKMLAKSSEPNTNRR